MGRTSGSVDRAPRVRRKKSKEENAEAKRKREEKEREANQLRGHMANFLSGRASAQQAPDTDTTLQEADEIVEMRQVDEPTLPLQ
jgi:hypothetical protein